MALSTNHAQTAGREHALALLGALQTGTAHGRDGLNLADGLLILLDLAQTRPFPALLDGGDGGVELLGRDALKRKSLIAQVIEGKEAGVTAQKDVGTTACHVGCDGDGALAASLCHDCGLALVMLRVQHLVLTVAHTMLLEDARETLGALDGDGAHQARLARTVTRHDLIGHGVELVVDGLEDEVVVVLPDDRAVWRNGLHGQVVDLAELRVLGHGGTGHASELVVQTEVVLQGDGRERLVLLANVHSLFGLDCLVQALGVAPALHDAAGELVDDLDLAVNHHVLLVAMEHVLGLQRLLQMVDELARRVGVDIVHVQRALDLGEAHLSRRDGVLCLVHLKVNVGRKAAHGAGKVLVRGRGLVAHTRDDERGTRLVDEDGVDLVHDGVVMPTLDAHVAARNHVVAQVVKAKLGVGAIREVRLIRRLLHVRPHAVLKKAHTHAHAAIDLAHPLAVSAGQVVVDGNDVHALAGDGIEVASQR